MVNLPYDYTVYLVNMNYSRSDYVIICLIFKETPEPERLKRKVLIDSSDSEEFSIKGDQSPDESDSSVFDGNEDKVVSTKEDLDLYLTSNFSVLRRQLFETDSQEDRISGHRQAIVDRFMKNPKLGHKTCLLCGTSFTEKKSLYRHYRAKKPCRERLTEKPKKLKTRQDKRLKSNTGNLK